MKKPIIGLFLLVFALFVPRKSHASHLLGSEISYSQVAGTTYEVRVKLYRDCSSFLAPTAVTVTVTSSCYASSQVTLVATGASVQISPNCPGALSACNGGTDPGIEQYTYAGQVQLNGPCQDWRFSISECCRGSVVTNVVNPASEPMYVYAELNNLIVGSNNSVVLTENPVSFLYVGQMNRFNNGAMDADGDSIVISLVDALSAATTPLNYINGYSGANPLPAQPSMTIDPGTGQAAVLPLTAGSNIIVYRFDEYRNGQRIGTTIRDFQTAVITSSNSLPTLSGVNGTASYATQVCAGDTLAIYLYSADNDVNDNTVIEVSVDGIGANALVQHLSPPPPVVSNRDSVLLVLPIDSALAAGIHMLYVRVKDGACPLEGIQSYAIAVQVGSCGTCGINVVDLQNHQYLFSVANQSTALVANWDFGDGLSGSGSTVSHTYPAAGSYNVCVTLVDTATGNQLCSSCTMVLDTFNMSGNCNITAQVSSASVVYFSVPSNPAAVTYHWTMGDGGTASGTNPIYTYASPGSYNVCVDVLGGGMILCHSCTTVVVGTPPPVCSAAFTAVSTLLTAFFIDQSTGLSAAATYVWDFGDQSTSTARFPQHVYALPGTYQVCLTVNDGTCSDTYCTALTIDTLINVSPVCQAVFIATQQAPYQLSVVNLSNGFNISFNWDFGDGSNSSLPYPSHTYASTGAYQLCLTVSDVNGCSDTYCDTVSVDSSGNLVRSMTGFTIGVVSPAMLTGVDEADPVKAVHLYPNPFTDFLKLDWDNGGIKAVDYRLMSIQGAEVLKGKLAEPSSGIDTGRLVPGPYLLELNVSGGYPVYHRIIKQ